MISASFFVGCSKSISAPPESTSLTGLQERVIHSRTIGDLFEADYDKVWWATISTLQLNGFILRDANKDSGYLYGIWTNAFELRDSKISSSIPLVGNKVVTEFKEIVVSITLEPKTETETVVRISSRADSTATSLDSAEFSRRFFAAIQKELFLNDSK